MKCPGPGSWLSATPVSFIPPVSLGPPTGTARPAPAIHHPNHASDKETSYQAAQARPPRRACAVPHVEGAPALVLDSLQKVTVRPWHGTPYPPVRAGRCL